jgi:hypothetical protein
MARRMAPRNAPPMVTLVACLDATDDRKRLAATRTFVESVLVVRQLSPTPPELLPSPRPPLPSRHQLHRLGWQPSPPRARAAPPPSRRCAGGTRSCFAHVRPLSPTPPELPPSPRPPIPSRHQLQGERKETRRTTTIGFVMRRISTLGLEIVLKLRSWTPLCAAVAYALLEPYPTTAPVVGLEYRSPILRFPTTHLRKQESNQRTSNGR